MPILKKKKENKTNKNKKKNFMTKEKKLFNQMLSGRWNLLKLNEIFFILMSLEEDLKTNSNSNKLLLKKWTNKGFKVNNFNMNRKKKI